MAKARAVVQVGDKKFEMQQFDLPRIGVDDALMRVEACGICGSDVDQYDGKLNGLLSLPMIPGHEPVGIIEEIGVEAARRWGLQAGDRVAVERRLADAVIAARANAATRATAVLAERAQKFPFAVSSRPRLRPPCGAEWRNSCIWIQRWRCIR